MPLQCKQSTVSKMQDAAFLFKWPIFLELLQVRRGNALPVCHPTNSVKALT